MSFQNNDSSDLDFSIIDKKPPEEAKLNFSVESLLSQHRPSEPSVIQSQSQHRNSKSVHQQQECESQIHEANAQNGSFLNCLQKLEHQMSFQTQLYNVYQEETQTMQSNSLNPANKSCLHAKSNSHLKTTKEESNNSRTLQLDDYGYLVLDFGSIKRKKSSKFSSNEKLNAQKLYTHQATSNNQKLKLSSSSGALTQNISIATIKAKSKHKGPSLNKLLSPRLPKNNEKSISKDKELIKSVKSKGKDIKKELKYTLEKTSKILSKPRQIQKHLNISKKTNASTTFAEISSKTNKSYTKSTRQANAYSEYYGFEDIGDSQRLVMKSNCLHYSNSEKNIMSPGKRKQTYLVKKSTSKSKCKQSFHSPSSRDLTMRFKKKKNNQIN